MQRFLTPASGSNDAVPPVSSQADGSHTEAPSAEQPGFQLQSIRDVQRWLAEEHIASCSGADIRRIREAVAVLSHPRKEDLQPLLRDWEVAQKKIETKSARRYGSRSPRQGHQSCRAQSQRPGCRVQLGSMPTPSRIALLCWRTRRRCPLHLQAIPSL